MVLPGSAEAPSRAASLTLSRRRPGLGSKGLSAGQGLLRWKSSAPLAQLDRASGYEPEGREFESLRARHFPSSLPLLD